MNAISKALGTGGAAALLALSLLAPGCGGRERPAPAAPVLASPMDVVPPDLDWVARLDVGRVYATLGNGVVTTLRSKALEKNTDGAAMFLTDALERSRIVVIATRYERGQFSDFVLALDGDFKGLDPRKYRAEPQWQPPIDLGGDVRRYDRKRPENRSDVMRLYTRSDELVVAATEAELDSVEAVVERGAPANRLQPRERGFLSVALRTRFELPRERFPELSRALDGARTAEGFFDTSGDGFRLEASCELASEADAKQAAEILESARAAFAGAESRFALLARHTTVEAQSAAVVLRAELGRDVLSNLVGEALR